MKESSDRIEPEELEGRIDALEHIVLQLTELMAGSNMHTNFKMRELLKPLQERQQAKAGIDAQGQ